MEIVPISFRVSGFLFRSVTPNS